MLRGREFYSSKRRSRGQKFQTLDQGVFLLLLFIVFFFFSFTSKVTYFLSFVWNTHLTEILSLGDFQNIFKNCISVNAHVLVAVMDKVCVSEKKTTCIPCSDQFVSQAHILKHLERKRIVFLLAITCILKNQNQPNTNKKYPNQFPFSKKPHYKKQHNPSEG